MAIISIKREDCPTSHWSGGTTTELFIYPVEAKYAERNFDIRISTARVDAFESTFTKLPQIHRHLMILEGEIQIIQEKNPPKTMRKGDKIFFPGDWDTKSIGICEDFNVMTSKKTDAAIDYKIIGAESCWELLVTASWKSVFAYCTQGDAMVYSAGTTLPLHENTLMLLTGENIESCKICANQETELILVFSSTVLG